MVSSLLTAFDVASKQSNRWEKTDKGMSRWDKPAEENKEVMEESGKETEINVDESGQETEVNIGESGHGKEVDVDERGQEKEEGKNEEDVEVKGVDDSQEEEGNENQKK